VLERLVDAGGVKGMWLAPKGAVTDRVVFCVGIKPRLPIAGSSSKACAPNTLLAPQTRSAWPRSSARCSWRPIRCCLCLRRCSPFQAGSIWRKAERATTRLEHVGNAHTSERAANGKLRVGHEQRTVHRYFERATAALGLRHCCAIQNLETTQGVAAAQAA
jgi:hypothetical protein